MSTESEPQTRGVLRRAVPRRLVFALVIVLPIVGFLIGSIGALGGGGTTTSATTSVTPDDIGLRPGKSGSVAVLVENPTDEGMRVVTIAASQSQATPGCPAGVLTSEETNDPIGYLGPNGLNAFPVTVTLKDNVPQECLKASLTLPLTVELESARG